MRNIVHFIASTLNILVLDFPVVENKWELERFSFTIYTLEFEVYINSRNSELLNIK